MQLIPIKKQPTILVLLGAAIAVIVGCSPAVSPGTQLGASTGSQETYQGIPVGFTEEGYPYRGDPNAPVTLEEYSDYLCPFCGRHFNQTLPALTEQYGQSGKVKYVFRDMPLASLHPTAPYGHEAARCVAEQGAALFWTMHDELFLRQQEWAGLPDPSSYLEQMAGDIGADRASYRECIGSGRQAEKVEASIAAGEALGFNATPSFQFIRPENDEAYTLVGAYPIAKFNEWMDALLAGDAPPQAQVAEENEDDSSAGLPYWANEEGLAPDPARPGFTMAGDPYRGNADASLIVVQFTDFQCPACREHLEKMQPLLDEQFVETGDVMWVVKQFPLRIHERAALAAVAAECAADQGAFWEMHDLLFETVDQWSVGEAEAAFSELAGQLDLDVTAFDRCFNGRQGLERVLADLYDAQGIVDGAPTFVVIYNGAGKVVRGALSETFPNTLQGFLEEARAAETK